MTLAPSLKDCRFDDLVFEHCAIYKSDRLTKSGMLKAIGLPVSFRRSTGGHAASFAILPPRHKVIPET